MQRNPCMNGGEGIMEQIKVLCSSVTEDTYDSTVRQGHGLLERLKGLGVEKEEAYQLLLQYHNSMEDGLSRDCAADILDFIAGWCAPQMWIWKD